jgi:hypothetical protein
VKDAKETHCFSPLKFSCLKPRNLIILRLPPAQRSETKTKWDDKTRWVTDLDVHGSNTSRPHLARFQISTLLVRLVIHDVWRNSINSVDYCLSCVDDGRACGIKDSDCCGTAL